MPDLLIIGGGPAGLAAAAEASAAGLAVTLVDENPALGGQIYRGIKANRDAPRHILGPDYFAGLPLVEAVSAGPTELALGSTAWSIEPHAGDFAVAVSRTEGGRRASRLIEARSVLIATGALERPFPIPGWTLPGVMTAGAAQSLLKQAGIVPSGPTILAGAGPLLYLIALQYKRAGVPIDRILLTAPRRNWLAALPHAAGFLRSDYLLKGAKMLAELFGRHVVSGVTELAAHGDGALAEVSYTAGGRRTRIAARTLLVHQGVVPQVSLAMAAGVEHRWSPARLAFEPVLDGFGETPVPSLFVAGDNAGIAGAKAAAERGRLAARRIVQQLTGEPAETDALRRNLRHALQGREFFDALYRPAETLRVPPDDVLVCRCEAVTAGAVRAACRSGATGPNQVKIFTRAGMGPCQGRLCGLTVAEIVAAETGQPMDGVGHPRLRFPSKPVTMSELAALHTGKSRHGKLF